MATITSAQSGLASAASTWVGGVVPVEGDKVIIAAGHVVELDGHYTWGDDSVTATIPNAAVNISGTLRASRTVDCSLTGRGLILLNQNNGTPIDFGTPADPLPAARKAALILNKAATPAVRQGLLQLRASEAANVGSTVTMVSANQRLHSLPLASTAAAGAASITVTSASHNWEVGDTLMFVTTTNNTNTNECEFRQITGISGATITLNTGLAFAHLAGSPAANMTRNIVVRSFNEVLNQVARIELTAPNNSSSSWLFRFQGVEFRNTGSTGVQGIIECISNPTGSGVSFAASFDRCSLWNTIHNTRVFGTLWTRFPSFTRSCFYTGESFTNDVNNACSIDDCVVVVRQIGPRSPFIMTNSWVTSIAGAGATNLVSGLAVGAVLRNVTLSGVGASLIGASSVGVLLDNCDLGFTYGYKMFFNNGGVIDVSANGYEQIVLKDCLLNANWLTVPDTGTDIRNASDFVSVQYLNKNRDVTQQEIWQNSGATFRENSIRKNGTSCVRIWAYTSRRPATRSRSIPCAAGQTIRVVGSVRMDADFFNGGNCTLPTVMLSGLGATPVTFTAPASANVWHTYDLSITNNSGVDGNFTLTFSASMLTAVGNVYFDGVPDDPFVTKVRHYGFLFNETSPTVTVNPDVTVSEAVAAAYTGMTINPATKRVTFGAGTIDTFAKLYDYSQAWGVQNIASDMPWSRVGQLLSLASGWTVVDPQIQGMTWGGGTIEFNTPGFIEGSFDGCAFNFNSAGTYDISAGQFAGTITLNNTSGGGVMVVLIPANINYVNNSPGTITVQPVVQQAVAQVSGIVSGSRLQVFNQTTNTEIANLIVTGTSWSLSYPDGNPFNSGDVVRVRLAYQSGATAKLPVQYRTVATSSGWSILADQQDDTIYNTNGIDGDTCTEFTHDFANVQVDVNDLDGSTTPQRGYAWYIAGQMTADGIRFFHGGISAIDAANYRINVSVVNMRIQNVLPNSHLMIRGARLFRSDGTSIFADHASGASASHDYGAAIPIETGVSGLTAAESDKLFSLNTGAVNVAQMNGAPVIGNGTEANPWRGQGVSP